MSDKKPPKKPVTRPDPKPEKEPWEVSPQTIEDQKALVEKIRKLLH